MGFCALAKSPDTQTCLFANFLFRRTDAKFPAQVADVAAAHHPAARIQFFLLHGFEKFKPEFHLLAGSGRSSIPGNGFGATRCDKLGDLLRQSLGHPPWSFGTSCHWSSSRVTLPARPRDVTSHHPHVSSLWPGASATDPTNG